MAVMTHRITVMSLSFLLLSLGLVADGFRCWDCAYTPFEETGNGTENTEKCMSIANVNVLGIPATSCSEACYVATWSMFGLRGIERGCAEMGCEKGCVEYFGIETCFQCCKGDLCNGAALSAPSAFLAMMTSVFTVFIAYQWK
ncbi:uncharacterized protein [Diadema setosum]|uniref:uncharacterized protein n=1 Tax=Diadema setosum TaxID=31175 RepID=UPI003B3A17C6